MNSLKVKTRVPCDTCGEKLTRVTTIKVNATNERDAKAEADAKVQGWLASLRGKNCSVCQSMINEEKRDKTS
jgi:hypothetical protein